MITSISIKNFKKYRDSEFEFKPLTVLTGVNSSGKTSVLQALLALRQSYMKGRLNFGLDLNEPLCKIGIGNDVLCRRAEVGEITVALTEDNSRQFSFVFDCQPDALKDSFLKKKSYSESVTDAALAASPLFNTDFQYISASRWGGKSVFPKETFEAETQRQISLRYGQGELVGNYLFAFGHKDVLDYTGGREEDLSLLNQVQYWERKISDLITIDVQQSNDSQSYKILYGYEGKGKESPLMDLKAENVGFGISYSLPVVVALLSAGPGSLVILENPEAHLHPKAQSVLAQLITMAAANGVQVIVETHSDHIISGIQLAVKKNSSGTSILRPDDVSIYYFNGDNIQPFEKIELRDNGRIEFQPSGFFDQAENDAFSLLESE